MKLTMTRGNTKQYDVAVTQGGTPFSLVDAQLFFTAKTAPGAIEVFQKTIGSGITVTDELNGTAVLEIEPADTNGLPSLTTSLYYDLEVERDGKVYTLVAGRLIVDPDITVR